MNRVYMGQIMAECDCPRREACEAAQKCLAEKPQPITLEEVFMEAVWDALKADTSDLGKQARILAAFRAAIDPAAIREAALREAAWCFDDDVGHPSKARDAILALIGETK